MSVTGGGGITTRGMEMPALAREGAAGGPAAAPERLIRAEAAAGAPLPSSTSAAYTTAAAPALAKKTRRA